MNIDLLKAHFEYTPEMEPADAVKLAFQHAFGCGHLLPDDYVQRIRDEILSTPEDADAPAAISLDGGLCRLNLASPMVRALGAEVIGRMMVYTDGFTRRGKERNQQLFEETLEQIGQIDTPFSKEAWQAYLAEYRAAGCPVVSHSETYRRAYHPAYRVVAEVFARVMPLVDAKLVVIDGPCGGGKTTLADALGLIWGVAPIPMDDFFLPPEMRSEDRLAQPGGNVHYERFLDEVIAGLRAGGDVKWNAYQCWNGQTVPRSRPAAPHVIVEGSYSHHPQFAQAWKELGAAKVFVEVNENDQLSRLAKRDAEMLPMFESRWIPLEKKYFEAYDIRRNADWTIQSSQWGQDGLFLRG